MAETYKINVQCKNCQDIPMSEAGSALHGRPEKIEVPKGKPVRKFLQELKCENCGCTGYMGLLQ